MSIGKVNHRDKRWGIVTAEVMQNTAMTTDARFLIAMVSTLPEDWKFRISWIRERTGWGKDKLQKVLAELIQHNHLARTRILVTPTDAYELENDYKPGQFAWRYDFDIEPKAEPEKAAMLKAATEKPAPQNKANNKVRKVQSSKLTTEEKEVCVENPVTTGTPVPDKTTHTLSLASPSKQSEQGIKKELADSEIAQVILKACNEGSAGSLSAQALSYLGKAIEIAEETKATVEEIKIAMARKIEEKKGAPVTLWVVKEDIGRLINTGRANHAALSRTSAPARSSYCGNCNNGMIKHRAPGVEYWTPCDCNQNPPRPGCARCERCAKSAGFWAPTSEHITICDHDGQVQARTIYVPGCNLNGCKDGYIPEPPDGDPSVEKRPCQCNPKYYPPKKREGKSVSEQIAEWKKQTRQIGVR